MKSRKYSIIILISLIALVFVACDPTLNEFGLVEVKGRPATDTMPGKTTYWKSADGTVFYGDSEGKHKIRKDSWNIPRLYDSLVKVSGATVSESIGSGSFKTASESPVPVTPSYAIGKYEVSYDLFYTVYEWAKNDARGENRYTFQKSNWVAPTNENAMYKPIVNLSWRDAIVWCNAYTEYFNAHYGTNYAPVYYSDETLAEPIRNNTLANGSNSEIDTTHGTTDNPYVGSDADGFRLPTKNEWEYAARGGDTDSGAWAFNYSGSDTSADVAWTSENAGGSLHRIGLKKANLLGIHDMSGNAWEWISDWHDDAMMARGVRGGSFDKTESAAKVDAAGYNNPGIIHRSRGLRICRTVLDGGLNDET